MANEYNDKVKETSDSVEETRSVQETHEYVNPDSKANREASEQPSKSSSSKKKSPTTTHKKPTYNITAMMSTVVAVTAVAVVGVSTGIVVVNDKTEAVIKVERIDDVSVKFTVDITGLGDKSAKIKVSNDFVNFSQDAEEGNNLCYYENLKPNIDYTIAVVGNYGIGGTTIAKQTFRTLESDAVPVTKLETVAYQCKCSVDGYFYFTMNFVDENNFWSNFSAYLEDSSGNKSDAIFTADPHGQQRIAVDVDGTKLQGKEATFVIKCMTTEKSSSEFDVEPEEKTLYETTVEI